MTAGKTFPGFQHQMTHINLPFDRHFNRTLPGLALSFRRASLGVVSTSAQAGSPGTTGTSPPHPQAFVTTHWSVVLTAGRSDTTRAHDALARLCQTYWTQL